MRRRVQNMIGVKFMNIMIKNICCKFTVIVAISL